jgi:hypothetical protein
MMVIHSPICLAQTDWSDNFDDGDYDGWTVLNGSFSASAQSLQATDVGPTTNWNLISHDSETTRGFWSFNLYGNTSTTRSLDIVEVYFLCDELTEAMHFSFYATSTTVPLNGYGFYIRIQAYDIRHPGIHFYKFVDGYRDTLEYVEPLNTDGWYHYNITRDVNGEFNVYVNDTLRLTVTDNAFTVSNTFAIFSFDNHRIDDIIVSGSTDPPPPQIPGFPAVVIGIGLCVGLGVGILIRRRYRS